MEELLVVVVYCALIAIGAVVSPANPALTAAEVSRSPACSCLAGRQRTINEPPPATINWLHSWTPHVLPPCAIRL